MDIVTKIGPVRALLLLAAVSFAARLVYRAMKQRQVSSMTASHSAIALRASRKKMRSRLRMVVSRSSRDCLTKFQVASIS
jgi:hypothetical protein